MTNPIVIDLSAQEIYDKVCAHLAKQKKRAMTSAVLTSAGIKSVACAYRGNDNTSCAIGCLVPDKEYRHSLEGSTVAGLIDGNFLKFTNLDYTPIRFLTALQNAHDYDAYDANEIKNTLVDIAKTYGLQAGAEQAIAEWNSNSLKEND